ITVGDEGKVFFSMSDQNVRVEKLRSMGSIYGIEITPEEQTQFHGMEVFEVPIRNMKEILKMEPVTKDTVQNGIPVDSTTNLTNELSSWVKQARLSSAKILKNRAIELGKDPDDIDLLTVAIKADANEKFPSLNLIIETLRNQKQNKFSFVTGLKSADQ